MENGNGNEIEYKTSIAVLKVKLETLDKSVNEIKQMLANHVDWEEKKYDDMQKDFAGKWVEKVVTGVIVVIATALIAIISKHGVI